MTLHKRTPGPGWDFFYFVWTLVATACKFGKYTQKILQFKQTKIKKKKNSVESLKWRAYL